MICGGGGIQSNPVPIIVFFFKSKQIGFFNQNCMLAGLIYFKNNMFATEDMMFKFYKNIIKNIAKKTLCIILKGKIFQKLF